MIRTSEVRYSRSIGEVNSNRVTSSILRKRSRLPTHACEVGALTFEVTDNFGSNGVLPCGAYGPREVSACVTLKSSRWWRHGRAKPVRNNYAVEVKGCHYFKHSHADTLRNCCLVGLVVKASASRVAGLGSIPAFAVDLYPGQVIAVTAKLVLRWPPWDWLARCKYTVTV